MRNLVRYTVLATALLLTFAIVYGLCADDERHGKRHRYRGGSHEGVDEKHDRKSEIHLNPVTNQTYKEACGACHLAYQPGLLPSGSWTKVLSNLKDHFGETVDIDTEPKDIIAKYLSGEFSGNFWSQTASKNHEKPERPNPVSNYRNSIYSAQTSRYIA